MHSVVEKKHPTAATVLGWDSVLNRWREAYYYPAIEKWFWYGGGEAVSLTHWVDFPKPPSEFWEVVEGTDVCIHRQGKLSLAIRPWKELYVWECYVDEHLVHQSSSVTWFGAQTEAEAYFYELVGN